MRAWFVLAAGVAAGATTGCGKLLGLDDPQLTDGGGGEIDAGVDAPANTVIGTIYNRLTTAAAGTVEARPDATGLVIQARIPDGAQPPGFRVVTGSGTADGHFVINDVPDDTTYYLKIGRAYYVTRAHTIDQHFEMPARSMPATATAPTPVHFALTGMQPWVAGPNNTEDSLEIHSFALAYQGNSSTDIGATSVVQDFDWQSGGQGVVFGGAPLPVAALGDDLHVFHSRSEPYPIPGGRKASFSHLLDWYDGGTVTVPNGVTTPISGAFTPAPNNRNLTLSYQRGGFDAAYTGTGTVSVALAVLGHPVQNDFGLGVNLAVVDLADWSRSTSTSVNLGLMYGDPLPASWTRMLSESYAVERWVQLPGTTAARPLFGGTTRLRPLPSGTPVLTPVLQPPGMVRIEGQDAVVGGKVAFDGTGPVTLTWSAVAGARLYQVNVFRAFANGNQTRTQTAGSLYTEGTTLDIPAEVFSGGEFFAFTVASVQTPANYAGGMIVPNGVPNSVAMVPTGLFRLSATCGNGSMDTGEQCDTGSESATCDVDCSTRACGDGLRNVAAGEQCDTQRDTLACDSDCTLPVCGDGHVNNQREDCDDGNTVSDGNGCSTECKFNNVCGDGLVQNLVEQCDGGGSETATCDRDCTLVLCGDGHTNTAAGEQCDFGGNNGSPGCTASCTLN